MDNEDDDDAGQQACMRFERMPGETCLVKDHNRTMAQGKSNLLVLFDIDGTLTVPRQSAKEDMLATLRQLRQLNPKPLSFHHPNPPNPHHRQHATVGVVGGSDLVKAKEQLGEGYVDIVDYAFPENGLQGFHEGKEFHKMSFVGWLGEAKLKAFINFCLHYIADLDIPIKRGTFIEFRSGMLNVSPIGRNCAQQERCDFEVYDQTHKIRETFIAALKTAFPDLGLKYSIGGQISFDVFPEGWDKSYCLQHVRRMPLLQRVNVTSKPGAAVQRRCRQGNTLLWRQDLPRRQRLRDFRASIRQGAHCDVTRGHYGAAEAAVSARFRQLSAAARRTSSHSA